ncbi:MAG: hypothetical protein ACLGJB_25150 [Blastocatellia bacterium]
MNVVVLAQQSTDADITQTRVIGEVTAIDASGKQITVKTSAGNLVTVILDEKTDYLRIPPGETSVDKAIKIALAEVGIGDKVYARGRVSEDKKSVPAQKLIVMFKADIQKKHEQERAEWQRRGIFGVITAINLQSKEVTVQTRGHEGMRQVVIEAPDGAKFRRYAPDSVKFGDAKPSSLSELKVGDQLRALGDKSADGTRLTAKQIVSGSFRTIGGTVIVVSAETNEIKVEMLGSKQPFTIVVNKDSMLRRIPPQVAMMIAQRSQGGGPGASISTGTQPLQGGGDFQDMLERMPALTLAEIKPGDVIAASSTTGADPSRLTAITLVTGVDAILTAMQRPGGARRTVNMSTGLPTGVLDFAMGPP